MAGPSDDVTDSLLVPVVDAVGGGTDDAPAAASVDAAAGGLRAGAAKVSIAPRPEDYGGTWEITTGPGELFSNLTNTIEEKSQVRFIMSLSQANDALGYLPQSFEMSPVGQQGPRLVLGGYLIVDYEDSYAIDRCFGDTVLETTLDLLAG